MIEAIFFDRLDHGRFASSFSKCADGQFFVYQAEISCRKTGFLQKRLKFDAKERRCAGDHNSSGHEIPEKEYTGSLTRERITLATEKPRQGEARNGAGRSEQNGARLLLQRRHTQT